ncbi:hypothetical protein IAU60_000683 [Kwoniella sp. DSM 27419]
MRLSDHPLHNRFGHKGMPTEQLDDSPESVVSSLSSSISSLSTASSAAFSASPSPDLRQKTKSFGDGDDFDDIHIEDRRSKVDWANSLGLSLQGVLDKPAALQVLAVDRYRLLSNTEASAQQHWHVDNPHIMKGFRPETACFKYCIWSIYAFLHNESMNILTHLIGATFFACLLLSHLLPFSYLPFLPASFFTVTYSNNLSNTLPMVAFLGSAVTCMGLSAGFHTLNCHSELVCRRAHRGDHLGIVALLVGSITPPIYYGFLDRMFWQAVYIGAIVSTGIYAAYTVVALKHRGKRGRRVLTFIGLGATAIVPTSHLIAAHGYTHARHILSLDLTIAGAGLCVIGALLYASRMPERLAPGRFDIFFASHQIFHILVFLAALCQYYALRGMMLGRASAVGPRLVTDDIVAGVLHGAMRDAALSDYCSVYCS